ncbi:hypothetical protein SCHPADRAFT_899127 [Schizopora paradoxa]|uniref:Uncharacterized protein n=1 Tax=Schizopora paradoxa TaxID=27342 RepID=A0A0H2S4H7_9AGAM|nr:hypothetical protein SCHPADRAFT_899127 [Schizopora paradoxa]
MSVKSQQAQVESTATSITSPAAGTVKTVTTSQKLKAGQGILVVKKPDTTDADQNTTDTGDEVPVVAPSNGTVTLGVVAGASVKQDQQVATFVPDATVTSIPSTVAGTVKATMVTAADHSTAAGTNILVIEKASAVRLHLCYVELRNSQNKLTEISFERTPPRTNQSVLQRVA